jgi:SAM-dependent methyltransferase
MDCAAQGAELLAPHLDEPDLTVLDVGCGGGHFRLSLENRGLEVDYRGLDHSPAMVRTARAALRRQGLDPSIVELGDVRDLRNFACDAVVMINVLSFCPDFREPFTRLAETGARVIVVRDHFSARTEIRYETDGFLDPGFNHLKGYWNRWSRRDATVFLNGLGYDVRFATDDRTGGRVELVVGKPYRWSWLVAEKRPDASG